MSNARTLSTEQALSLEKLTDEIVAEMPELENEINCDHKNNVITIIVGTSYGSVPVSVAVQHDDTATSVYQRFVDLIDQEYSYREGVERYHNENYEHASVTQGRAFDSLTC